MKKLLHVADAGRKSVIGQAVEKHLSITLFADPIVQQNQYSPVRTAANQPSKPLFERNKHLRNLIIVERISAGFPNLPQTRIHDWIARNRERQPINDNAA